MNRIIALILAGAYLLSGCSREDRVRENIAGSYVISHYTCSKMDSLGKYSIVIQDTTDLAKLILWDSDRGEMNQVTYVGNLAPVVWGFSGVGTVNGTAYTPIYWYADYEAKESLTLWSWAFDDTKYRTTYNMDKCTEKEVVIHTVFYHSTGTFLEELTLTRTE
jgi:hypothetical protein